MTFEPAVELIFWLSVLYVVDGYWIIKYVQLLREDLGHVSENSWDVGNGLNIFVVRD
jgi:hypothetical protein